MTWVRDFFRRRRVARHVRAHGWNFEYFGLKIRLPEGTATDVASALLRHKYEAEEIRMIRAYLPASQPVIELGGSLGVVSAVIGQHLDPDTAHLVVEANPHLRSICQENAAAAGNTKNLRVIERAIGYGGPVVTFEVAENPHVSRISTGRGQGNATVVEVRTETLAGLHKSIGEPDGFSLVCDIEGGEVDMLRHDASTVAAAGTVIMELHPEAGPEAAAQTPETMKSMGFDLLDRSGNVYAWKRAV